MFIPSVHRDSWSSLKYFGGSYVFEDDFAHDHHLTWKARSVSTQLGFFKFKQMLDYRRDGHVDTLDELRFWYPVENRAVFSRINNDSVKIHVDNGVTNIKDHLFNFYGSIDFHKNWSKASVKIGGQNLSSKCNSDNRLKIDDEFNLTWGHRTLLHRGNWKVGIVGVVDVTGKKILKKDFLLGYVKDQVEVYFSANQDWKRQTKDWRNISEWFSGLSLIGLYARNIREKYGVEVDVNPWGQKINHVTALVEYNQNINNGLKVKLNEKLNLSFVLKRRFSSQLSVSLGACLPLTHEIKSASKVGLKVDLTV